MPERRMPPNNRGPARGQRPPRPRRPDYDDRYREPPYEHPQRARGYGEKNARPRNQGPPRRGAQPRQRNYRQLPPRKGMPFLATFVITLLFGYIVIYMGRGVHSFLSPTVDITTLRLGNMESQQSIPGLIIRNEEVFQASRDGRVVFNVQEFDHVRADVLVASIQDIEAIQRNELEMSRLQQEVMDVHDMRHTTLTDPLVEHVNNNLRNRMNRSMHHHMQMNLSEIYALQETLKQITNNRNQMITNESLHVRSDLNRQHGALSEQYEMNSNDIYASHSGIMSPLIDGFETQFTPQNMRELSREQVHMGIDVEAIIPGREVSAGDDVFKIVGNTWYVISWMPNEMVHGYTIGSERILYLENTTTGRYERVPMTIEYMDNRYRETVVVFQSTRNVIEFLNQRNVNIRVSDSVQEGYIVPSSAIATRRYIRIPLSHVHGTDEFFLMHRRDDGIQPIPITVHERDENYVYILEETLPLSLGDSISPVEVTDTYHVLSEMNIRIVHGVYLANLNVADFREVNIDGELLEAGNQIILDPARNPGIRQFDAIVTDAAMVRQDMTVR